MPVKTMQKMLSRREKIQKLIDNLETVRTGGETDEGQYNMLKAQYDALRVQADDNLKQIRDELHRRNDTVSREIDELEKEVQTIQLRAKVGEIGPDEVAKRLNAIQKKRLAMATRQSALNAALAAQSSADVGGHIDVDMSQPVVLSKGFSLERIASKETVGKAAAKIKQLGGGGVAAAMSGSALPADKRLLQQIAACAFCLIAPINLVRAITYFRVARVARLAGGIDGFLRNLGGAMGIESGGSSVPSSALLFFVGVLLLAVTAALVVSIVGLFAARHWSARLTLITCMAGLVAAVLGMFALGFQAIVLLTVPVYVFGAYTTMDL